MNKTNKLKRFITFMLAFVLAFTNFSALSVNVEAANVLTPRQITSQMVLKRETGHVSYMSAGWGCVVTATQYATIQFPNSTDLPTNLRGTAVTNYGYCLDSTMASAPWSPTAAGVEAYFADKALYYIMANGARTNQVWGLMGQSAPYQGASYNATYRTGDTNYDHYLTQMAIRGLMNYSANWVNSLSGSGADQAKALYHDAIAYRNNPNTGYGTSENTVLVDKNNNPVTKLDKITLQAKKNGVWSNDTKVEWKYTTDASITGGEQGEEYFTTSASPYFFGGNKVSGFQTVFKSDYFPGGIMNDVKYQEGKNSSGFKVFVKESGSWKLLKNLRDLVQGQEFYMVVPAKNVQDYMIGNPEDDNDNKSVFSIIVEGTSQSNGANGPSKISVSYRSIHLGGYRQRLGMLVESAIREPEIYSPAPVSGESELKVGFVWVQKELDTSNLQPDLAEGVEKQGLDGYQVALKDTQGNVRYTGTTNVDGMVKFNAVLPGKYTLVETSKNEYSLPLSSTAVGQDITVTAGVKTEKTINNEMRFIDLIVKKYAEDAKYDDIRFKLTGTTKAFYTDDKAFFVPSMKVDKNFPALDENHETKLTGLLPGDYTITEAAPNRYVEVVPKHFTLNYKDGTSVQTVVTKVKLDKILADNEKEDYGFTNLIKRIHIPIQKVDEDLFESIQSQTPSKGTSYHPEYNTQSSNQLSFEGAVFEIYADETITGYICEEHEHATPETKKACPNCEYWEAGDLVWTLTTNENGYATTDINDTENNVANNGYTYYQSYTGIKSGTAGLPAGKYHIEEKKAPEGYLRAVVRDENGRPLDKNGNILYDLDIYGNEITDKDASNQPQPIIGTFAQDRKEAVPIEYTIDGSSNLFEDISSTIDITFFKNAPMKHDVHITKHLEADKDGADAGKHAAGAGILFELISVTGDKTYSVTTNQDGEATFKDVLYGEYTLHERRTPAAYTCPECKAALTSENYASEKEIKQWKEDNKVDTVDKFGDVYLKCPKDGKIFKTVLTGNEGYKLMDPIPVSVRTDNSNADGIDGYNTPLHFPLGNQINQEWIQIVKKDDETKLNVLMPEGAMFKIKDVVKDEYISQKIYYQGEYTTTDTFPVNAKGFVILPETLKAGKYQLEEIKAPDNYIIYKDPIPFEINGDGLVGNTGLLTDEFSGGHVKVEEGPFVGISNPNVDSTSGIVVTFFDMPQYGKIQITKTGEGFTAETVSTETIGSKLNQDEETVEVHTPVYTNINLEGAVFGIYAKEEINTYDCQVNEEGLQLVHYEKDELIEKVTTNEKGIATSEELPIASYYVKELKAPVGYVLDETPHNVDILYAGQEELVAIDGSVSAFDARQKLEITPFVKHMEVNKDFNVGMNNELKDVWFGVFASQDMTDNKGNVIIKRDSLLDVKSVNDDGKITFDVDLPFYQKVGDFAVDGYYYVKELKTNIKYVLDTTAYPAEFQWTVENSKLDKISIEINKNETEVSTLDNHIEHGPFELTKTDLVTSEPLPNAGIRITDMNGNVFFEGYTDENGKISIPELPVGTYLYQEFDAPEGYIIDTNKYEFTLEKTIDGHPVITKAQMDNKAITNDVKIIKYEMDSDSVLENCGIVIKNEKGEEIFRGYTDKNGEINIKSLPYGKYTAYEFEAPEGYVLDDRIISFEVSEPNAIVELKFYDKPIEGKLQLHKQDISTSESLPNTGIRIIDKSTGKIVFEGYTDENGDLTIEGLTAEDGITLKAGKYEFYEFDAPEGYVLPEEHFEFEITEDGQIVKGVMTNKKIVGTVLIEKTDIVTSEPLPDTGIRIKNEKGDIVVEGRTDENGEFKFEGLEYGKYTYQEFDAPEGYIIDENEYPFEITEDGEIVKCQLENKKVTGSFDFTKQDLVTDAGLPDTGIRIKNEKGDIVFEGRTDKDGKIVIEDLEYGKYTYQEFDAPKGYIIDENEYPFEIKENGEIVKAVMKNELIKSKFELTKTDYVSSEALPNAGIRIVNKDTGKLVLEGYTDKNGKIVIEELPAGNYTYQEFEAPEGYIIDTTPYPFSVTKDGEIIRCELKNVAEVTPNTGDVNPIVILVAIGVVALIGGTGYIIIKKRKKDEK